jgi:hypothetical protein
MAAMSEAWHEEQLAAIAPAPELSGQHEPSAACGGMHCYRHHVDEPAEGAYKTCGECGHVYRTEADLRREWTASAPPDLPGRETPPSTWQIYFCPLCLHDF